MADLVGENAHDLRTAAKGRRGVAVAHRLGKRPEIRLDPEELCRATARQPEPGLDLVEDEQNAEFLGQRSHRLVKVGLGHDRLGVAKNRLHDDRRDLVPLALEQAAQESMLL